MYIVKIIPHRHAQRPISQVILDSVKLTLTITITYICGGNGEAVLGIEPMVSPMLGKCPITELHIQHDNLQFEIHSV